MFERKEKKPFGQMCVLRSTGSTRGVSKGHWQVATHLGAGGHGDIQVTEDVLCVLVFHSLSQE